MVKISGQCLRWLLRGFLVLSISGTQASSPLTAGQLLPLLSIDTEGELLLQDGARQFEPWQSDSGLGATTGDPIHGRPQFYQ